MDFFQRIIDRIIISDIDKLKSQIVLVTGATGLIGSNIIRYLISKEVKVIGVARDSKKAQLMDFYESIDWIYQNLYEDYLYNGQVDYIIHTASPTDSSFFVSNPVETIESTFLGLSSLLKFSLNNKIKGMVFLSSLEVYGICNEDRLLGENEYSNLDFTNVRNSYPEGKRLLECLCVSYATEYGVPVKIVRLGQTFGPGVTISDNRVFSQFAQSVTTNKDIVLKTKGETKRSYCSLADAVCGIINVLINGEKGEAYNLASDNSYYSIYEMAQMFAKGTTSRVVIAEEYNNKYLPTIKFGLDTKKIKKIGFVSTDNLQSIIDEFKEYYSSLILD